MIKASDGGDGDGVYEENSELSMLESPRLIAFNISSSSGTSSLEAGAGGGARTISNGDNDEENDSFKSIEIGFQDDSAFSGVNRRGEGDEEEEEEEENRRSPSTTSNDSNVTENIVPDTERPRKNASKVPIVFDFVYDVHRSSSSKNNKSIESISSHGVRNFRIFFFQFFLN